jgi:hypothetical protein
VRELGPGLWHWEAPHPEWTPGAGWDELVSSYAIDDGERLLLFDPLAVPSEIEGRAAERETAIVLTSPWHERDARSVQERLGARVFVPPRDGASPDVAWLEAEEGHIFSVGDRLPVGVEVFPGLPQRCRVLGREPPYSRCRGTRHRPRRGSRDPGRLASRGRDARAGRRSVAPAARAIGRTCARDARRAERPGRSRAGALLTPRSPVRLLG